MGEWMYGFAALFMLLLLKNLLEFLVSEGRVGRLVRDFFRILIFVWILGSLGSLLTFRGWENVEVLGDLKTQSLEISNEDPVWLQTEYEQVLTEQAQPVLEQEGMTIENMEVQIAEDYTIDSVSADLTSLALKESSVEICITDITLEDPATDRNEYYTGILADSWGIPQDCIRINIKE